MKKWYATELYSVLIFYEYFSNHSLCMLPEGLFFFDNLNHPADFSGSRGIEMDLEISRLLSPDFLLCLEPRDSTDRLLADIFLSSLSRLYLEFSLGRRSFFLYSVEFEPLDRSSRDFLRVWYDDRFSFDLDFRFNVEFALLFRLSWA